MENSLEQQLEKLILDMESKKGHRVADITTDIYNRAFLLKSAAESYAASACRSQSARNQMQSTGRDLVRNALFLAYLLNWDMEENGVHMTPSESMLSMLNDLMPRTPDLTSSYKRARRYEGD